MALSTSIELMVAGLSIDWSKNAMGADHGVLFQEQDRQRRHSIDTDYDYFGQHPEEDVSVREAAFVRPLLRVLPSWPERQILSPPR